MTTHEAQAAAEGVVVPKDHTGDDGQPRVEFMGGLYRISDRIGLMPLMKFAHAASSGLDSEDMEGLAAMYAMLRDCIHPDDWPQFERDAMDKRAGDTDLMPVVSQTIELLTARPTKRPGDSSAGPQPTSENSRESSSSPDAEDQLAQLIPVTSLLDRSTG